MLKEKFSRDSNLCFVCREMERKLEEEEMKEDQGGGCDDDGDEYTDNDEGMNADEGDTDEDFSVEKKASIGRTSGPGQKCVPGIIYLGHIPPRLRPKHLRNMLSSYGEVGRVFLQPEGEGSQSFSLFARH